MPRAKAAAKDHDPGPQAAGERGEAEATAARHPIKVEEATVRMGTASWTDRLHPMPKVAQVLAAGVLAISGSACTGASPSVEPSQAPPVSSAATPSAHASSGASLSAPSPTPVPPAGWTDVVIGGVDRVGGIAEQDGRLVAVGNTESDQPHATMAFSDDGVHWTPVDMARFDGVAIFGADPGFVAIAYNYSQTAPPELTYLFSADGETWETATPPADCFTGRPVFAAFGYVALGAACSPYEDAPIGPLYILTSADGRTWTTRRDDERVPGVWATDGHRIVLLANESYLEPTSAWISDDQAKTWRFVETPFPATVNVSELTWRDGRYIARASWLIREGDPDPAACVSEDGESWQCEVIAAEGEMATRDYLGLVAATPTGFVSLAHYPNDLFAPSGSTMVIGTSADGLEWTFEVLPEMADRLPYGLTWTSHGLFVVGGTDPEADPSGFSQSFMQVHRAPLP